MKITDGEVTLTEKEAVVAAERNLLMDQHYTVQSSALSALDHFKGKPSKKFVEWLSEGTLTITDGEVVKVEPAEAEPAPA